MSGLLLFFLLIAPRVALVLMYANSYLIQRAFHAFSFPYGGFLFLPLTTMAYAWMVNSGQSVTGIGVLTLAITIAADVATIVSIVFHRSR
jgi:hypothetical protein